MRLFIGVPLEEHARRILAEKSRMIESRCPGRFSEPELYHITLAFLGETDERVAREALRLMRESVSGVGRFSLSLCRLGFFSSQRNALLWCGTKDSTRLEELALSIREGLDARGIWFDRKPFKAHITLGRMVDLGPLPPDGFKMEPISFEAGSVVLYESRRINGKLSYVNLGEAFLHPSDVSDVSDVSDRAD